MVIMSTGYPTRELQELEIPIVDQEECKQKYDPEQITDDMICAGIPYDGKDTCPVSGTVDLAMGYSRKYVYTPYRGVRNSGLFSIK